MSATYDPDERWQEIKETALHRFSSLSVREVINRSTSWSLPDPYVCIVRTYDHETGKVREKAFKRRSSANRFVDKMIENNLSILAYDDEMMHERTCTGDFYETD